MKLFTKIMLLLLLRIMPMEYAKLARLHDNTSNVAQDVKTNILFVAWA